MNVDDAEPVGQGLFELEAGIRYDNHPNSDHYDFPVVLTYGLFPRIEIGVGFGNQVERREELRETRAEVSGIDDLTLSTKAKLLDIGHGWASQAISFSVKIPTADEHRSLGSGCIDYDLTWILSKPLGSKSAMHFNAGYTWVGKDHDPGLHNLFHFGIATDYQLTGSVQLVGEVCGITSVGEGFETTAFFNAGCRWKVRSPLVLDAAIGHGFTGRGAKLIATIGLTWGFGCAAHRQ